MKKIHSILIVLGAVLLFVSLSEASYMIRLQWVPQTQFAGYYMAAEKGFYQEVGIDADVRPADPKFKGLLGLLFKKNDFETAWLASGLIMRSNHPRKLVLIAQFFQKPALMLVAKKSSGIKSVRDFRGRTLGVWDGVFSILPRALIKKHTVHRVNIVSQGFTVEPFVKGDIDIASAMRYNEYKQILDAGIKEDELTVFDFSKLGMNLPEDGLYVREKFAEKHPDVCRKVVEATLKGWKYALEHKDETVAHITKIVNQTEFRTTTGKQRWMLDVVGNLIDLNTTVLKKADFDRTANMLKSLKMIRERPAYSVFFRDVMK